jgi:hypothetical protein
MVSQAGRSPSSPALMREVADSSGFLWVQSMRRLSSVASNERDAHAASPDSGAAAILVPYPGHHTDRFRYQSAGIG